MYFIHIILTNMFRPLFMPCSYCKNTIVLNSVAVILLKILWIKCHKSIEQHFVGYLYIIYLFVYKFLDVINAPTIEHNKNLS
jgi:hypothetical protein